VTPLNDTIFGWSRRFHNTASFQSASKACQGMIAWSKTVRTRYLFNHCLIDRGECPKPFDADTRFAEGPFINIAESTICNHPHGTE